MTFALMYDDLFLDHYASRSHPECPERLSAIMARFEARGWLEAMRIPARDATMDELSLAHDPEYIEDVLRRIEAGSGYLDPDTFFSEGTKRAVLAAAGGTIDAARAVAEGRADFAFALNRPPGHHATARRAMGFCILNHTAIAAHALLADGAERILIFDWDVHHGNGTQNIFYDDPRVLFISVHQWPQFPGTGRTHEIGEGQGKGFSVNLPFPAGAVDADYAAVMDRVVLPLARNFNPELVLVSAGFDAHERDPLGGMRLTTEVFAYMTARIFEIADKTGCGPCFVLEGGYDLTGLADAAAAVVYSALTKKCPKIDGSPSDTCTRIIDAALAARAG